jgi:hypothetical protein
MSQKRPHTWPFTIETVSMRQATAWTVSNLRHPPFEWSVSLPRITDMRNAHVWQNVVTSQPMTCSSWIEHVILRMTSYGNPRARHPISCVRPGDLTGVAQIDLLIKNVSYYPQTEEWWEPPGWWTLSEDTSRVFRSGLNQSIIGLSPLSETT